MSACETHDPSTFTNDGVGARNFCPTCRNRVCLRCGEAPAALSWSSGFCNGCYGTNRREQEQRRFDYDRQEKQRRLAEAWEEGRIAGNQSVKVSNPYLEAQR